MAGKASEKGSCHTKKMVMRTEAGKSHSHEGQWVIEENLYGMEDKWIL